MEFLNKAQGSAAFLEKAKDISKLQKKIITDKRGKQKTVWVKTGDEPHEEKRMKEVDSSIKEDIDSIIAGEGSKSSKAKKLAELGVSTADIAKKLDMHYSHVYSVVKGIEKKEQAPKEKPLPKEETKQEVAKKQEQPPKTIEGEKTSSTSNQQASVAELFINKADEIKGMLAEKGITPVMELDKISKDGTFTKTFTFWTPNPDYKNYLVTVKADGTRITTSAVERKNDYTRDNYHPQLKNVGEVHNEDSLKKIIEAAPTSRSFSQKKELESILKLGASRIEDIRGYSDVKVTNSDGVFGIMITLKDGSELGVVGSNKELYNWDEQKNNLLKRLGLNAKMASKEQLDSTHSAMNAIKSQFRGSSTDPITVESNAYGKAVGGFAVRDWGTWNSRAEDDDDAKLSSTSRKEAERKVASIMEEQFGTQWKSKVSFDVTAGEKNWLYINVSHL